MSDQLKTLPPFTWRGIAYPVTKRSFNFAHESVQHKLQRRNNDLVEQTGAHNPTITYTIPMYESFFHGAYKALFSEGLKQLLADFRDKSPGTLEDPIYGELRCVPSSYSDELDALKRSGVDLVLEFRHSPEEDDEDLTITASAAVKSAEDLAVEAQEFERAAEEEAAEISPQNSVKLKDALSRIGETGRRILATPNDIRSELNQIAFFAKEIEDIAVEANVPGAVQVRDSARSVREKAYKAIDNSLLIRPAKFYTLANEISAVGLAALLGVSFESFIRANPSIASYPLVPVGTRVVVPDDSP